MGAGAGLNTNAQTLDTVSGHLRELQHLRGQVESMAKERAYNKQALHQAHSQIQNQTRQQQVLLRHMGELQRQNENYRVEVKELQRLIRQLQSPPRTPHCRPELLRMRELQQLAQPPPRTPQHRPGLLRMRALPQCGTRLSTRRPALRCTSRRPENLSRFQAWPPPCWKRAG